MTRRLVVGVVALSLVAGACGLGDKQAQSDRITAAGKRLMARSAISAALGVDVRVLPVERQLVQQEPPRISAGQLSGLGSVLRPTENAASVAGVVLFVDDAMYQRIVPSVTRAPAAGSLAPSNLSAIAATVQGLRILDAAPAPTTSTTVGRTLGRRVQIVREWAAFDFAAIEDRDGTKHGGSLALNPVALLRLTTGVLTGSVERVGPAEYKANVSRDKAERKLSEDEREVLDKVFGANAITRRVFPARFGLRADGQLAFFSVRLRQQLSSKDRADMTVSFVFDAAPAEATIARPPRRGTVTANTLTELVTMVSGA